MATHPQRKAGDGGSPRLAMIEQFTAMPPETDYQKGYFACLMDEAALDLDEAGSDIFDKALQVFPPDNRRRLVLARSITLR